MTILIKPLPANVKIIARIKRKGKTCYISGAVESETRTMYRNVKTMLGVFIRDRVKKSAVHLSSCKNCPSEKMIQKELLDGRDPRDVR